jgi:hypothetical protein
VDGTGSGSCARTVLKFQFLVRVLATIGKKNNNEEKEARSWKVSNENKVDIRRGQRK